MRKAKILIVEDETVMREALETFLQNEGYEINSAVDGEEGIKVAKSFAPDLVLLDIILPKKDGLEVLREIKTEQADHSGKTPLVVILTNLNDSAKVQEALDLGATTYLVKSEYQLSEIGEKIKELLHLENKE